MTNLSNLIPQTAKGRDFITSIRPEDSHGKPASINVESKESSFSGNRIVWHVQKLRSDNNAKVRDDFVKMLFDSDDISDIKKNFAKDYKNVMELIGTDRKKPLDIESARNAIMYKEGKLNGLSLTGKAAEVGDKSLIDKIMTGGVISIPGTEIANPVTGTKLEKTLERFALLKVNVEKDEMKEKGLDGQVDWNERANGEIAKLNNKVGDSINSSKDVLEGFADTLISQVKQGREKLRSVVKEPVPEPKPKDNLTEEYIQVMKEKGLWEGVEKKTETIETKIFKAVAQNVTETQSSMVDKVDDRISTILDDPKLSDKEKVAAIQKFIEEIEYKPELTEDEKQFVEDAKQHATQWTKNERRETKETALDKAAERYSSQVKLPLSEIKLFLAAEAQNRPEYQTDGKFDPEKYVKVRLDAIASTPYIRLMNAVDYKLQRTEENEIKKYSGDLARLYKLVDVMNEKEITGQENVKAEPKSGEDDEDIDTPTSITLDHNGFKAELEKMKVDMEVFRILHSNERIPVN